MNFETLKKGDLIQGVLSKVKYIYEGLTFDGKKVYVKMRSLDSEKYHLVDYATACYIFEEVKDDNK